MRADQRYLAETGALLARQAETQAEAIDSAAVRIADCLAGGHRLYTFGTGHGHLLALEIFYRAGGPVNVCPILDERLMLHQSASESTGWERREEIVVALLDAYPMAPGDVLIAASNSGRNAAPVLLAAAARARGVYVIALTSMRHTSMVTARNSLGRRLFEEADLVLDNGGVLGDASIESTDGGMIGPTSTVIGAALLHATLCRAEEIAHEKGQKIDFFASSNIDGGDEINRRFIDRYKQSIPAL